MKIINRTTRVVRLHGVKAWAPGEVREITDKRRQNFLIRCPDLTEYKEVKKSNTKKENKKEDKKIDNKSKKSKNRGK